MDDVQNRLAREIADAVAAAVARSAEVASCRERARGAGFDLKITLEATVGFATRGDAAPAPSPAAASSTDAVPVGAFEVTASDRRFLRSLRIAADQVKVEETN